MIPTGEDMAQLIIETVQNRTPEHDAEMSALVDDEEFCAYLASTLSKFTMALFEAMVADGMPVNQAMVESTMGGTLVFFKGAFDAGREHQRRQSAFDSIVKGLEDE